MPIMFGKSFLSDPTKAEARKYWKAQIAGGDRLGVTRAVKGVIVRKGILDEIGAIKCPTLVLVGDEDVATVPDKSRRIQSAVPGAELVIIPGAGHSSTIEQPERVTAALGAFLDRVNGGVSPPFSAFFVCADLVPCLGVKVSGIVTLTKLRFWLTKGAVDHAAPADRCARVKLLRPASHVLVAFHVKEFTSLVKPPKGELPIPGPVGHISDGVILASKELIACEALIQHVELAFDLHGEAINRVLPLFRRVGVEMAKTAAR